MFGEASTGNPRLIPILEAAKIIGVQPGTLRKWGYTGQVKTVRLGRKVMVPREQIESIVKNGIQP
ncbi:hypothetical protein [uncultured Mobiluncus sp.]|uniref:hypothetical protein n=1 Tax=uncultured Mobiluncus sp. TaxID=293425 RepID=UPI00260D600C|nr:hypothetical protein [uncultured Mobiluncus sp.]